MDYRAHSIVACVGTHRQCFKYFLTVLKPSFQRVWGFSWGPVLNSTLSNTPIMPFWFFSQGNSATSCSALFYMSLTVTRPCHTAASGWLCDTTRWRISCILLRSLIQEYTVGILFTVWMWVRGFSRLRLLIRSYHDLSVVCMTQFEMIRDMPGIFNKLINMLWSLGVRFLFYVYCQCLLGVMQQNISRCLLTRTGWCRSPLGHLLHCPNPSSSQHFYQSIDHTMMDCTQTILLQSTEVLCTDKP